MLQIFKLSMYFNQSVYRNLDKITDLPTEKELLSNKIILQFVYRVHALVVLGCWNLFL